jgi:hypothetical protein
LFGPNENVPAEVPTHSARYCANVAPSPESRRSFDDPEPVAGVLPGGFVALKSVNPYTISEPALTVREIADSVRLAVAFVVPVGAPVITHTAAPDAIVAPDVKVIVIVCDDCDDPAVAAYTTAEHSAALPADSAFAAPNVRLAFVGTVCVVTLDANPFSEPPTTTMMSPDDHDKPVIVLVDPLAPDENQFDTWANWATDRATTNHRHRRRTGRPATPTPATPS